MIASDWSTDDCLTEPLPTSACRDPAVVAELQDVAQLVGGLERACLAELELHPAVLSALEFDVVRS